MDLKRNFFGRVSACAFNQNRLKRRRILSDLNSFYLQENFGEIDDEDEDNRTHAGQAADL